MTIFKAHLTSFLVRFIVTTPTNTLNPTFIFKTMDINHQSCPPSYKFLNDLSKTTSLHFTIHMKINMLVELCASNYVTSDGLVNGANGIFKASTTYYEKTII